MTPRLNRIDVCLRVALVGIAVAFFCGPDLWGRVAIGVSSVLLLTSTYLGWREQRRWEREL